MLRTVLAILIALELKPVADRVVLLAVRLVIWLIKALVLALPRYGLRRLSQTHVFKEALARADLLQEMSKQ